MDVSLSPSPFSFSLPLPLLSFPYFLLSLSPLAPSLLSFLSPFSLSLSPGPLSPFLYLSLKSVDISLGEDDKENVPGLGLGKSQRLYLWSKKTTYCNKRTENV